MRNVEDSDAGQREFQVISVKIFQRFPQFISSFRVITDSFHYNRPEAFSLFLEYLDAKQLGHAREFVDRIYDRNKSGNKKELRQMVIHRQLTID